MPHRIVAFLGALLGLVSMLAVAACSSVPRLRHGHRASVRSYGTTPRDSVDPGELKGLASWYGKRHQHRRTASGERFDMYDLTAAHRTLPFGTRVEVTNVKTGKSVVVRINDRGPFSSKRVIDVSFGAAKSIGLLASGVAAVELKVLN